MKEIKEEIVKKEYKIRYQAIDGEMFDSREECQKYDNTAKAVLISKYNKLVKKSLTEYNLLDMGCDDNDLDLVVLNTPEDVDVLKQVYCFMNGWDINSEDKCGWRDEAFAKIDKSFNNNDPLLIGKRLCDECFWINGTKSEMIKKIEDFCKIDETKQEPEYGGC